MSDKITLTRQQLAQFLPDFESVTAFEQLIANSNAQADRIAAIQADIVAIKLFIGMP